MTRFCQNGHGQIAKRFTQRIRDVAQVIRQRQIEIDRPFGARTDNQFFHIHIGRIQETAFIADRQHRQRVRLTHRRHARALNRIDGDIYRIAVAGTDFLADIEHRGLVDFAFANHDGAVNVDLVEHDTHGVDRRAVRGIFIAASQPFVASQRRRFGHTGKFDGKFSSHNKLVAKRSGAQCSTGEGGNN